MTVDPLVSLLIGAFGASLIGLVGALVGAAVQARREHQRWIRQLRFEAYREYQKVIDGIRNDSEMKRVLSADYLNELQQAMGGLRLLGTARVMNAARAYWVAAFVYSSKLNSSRTKGATSTDQDSFVTALENLETAADRFTSTAQHALGISPSRLDGEAPASRIVPAVKR